MAYTQHGYHIPGTDVEPDPPNQDSCGGPRFCKACRRDLDNHLQQADEIRQATQRFMVLPPGMEVRTISSTGGEKGTKQERYDLLPVEALAEVAKLYGKGADKYSAHNWRKGYEWSKSYAALQRHANAFWQGEDQDPEMELPHMAAVVFHALALLTFMKEQPNFDDRFKTIESSSIDDVLGSPNFKSYKKEN